MKEKHKDQKIKELVRDDYPFPFIQDLIIEILMATSEYDKRALSRRFDATLKAVLGKPKRPRRMSDDHKDEKDAYLVGYLMTNALVWKRKLSRTAACEEVARRRVLGKNYKHFGELPDNISDATYTAIKSKATAIARRIKENKKLERSSFFYQIENMMFEETDPQEKQMILDVFESWKKRHLARDKN